jgi:3-deoxy-D-manno-octulosonic acid kinase
MMSERWVLGPEARHVAVDGGAMLYDTSRAGNLVPGWLDRQYWAARDAITGTAQGRGTTLYIASEGQRFVLRHYHRGGLLRSLLHDRYPFLGEWRTRPLHEWSLTYHLHRNGLPVPVPIAARFRRSGPYYTGDLLTVRIDAARSLAQRVTGDGLPINDWLAVGRCIRRFHDFGLYHADLNAHNVLFDASGEVYLIDFDRCRIRPRGLWCDANLVRLRRSLLKITDPLPGGRFTEPEWHSLLVGYAVEARRAPGRTS